MKQKIIVLSVCTLLLIAIATILVLFRDPTAEVNNTTPAKELVTREYGLEKELLAKAIFYVRRGFEDVNAYELASEVGMKLECKRKISNTLFYYVIVGDYRCFLIVDEKDIVHEVLTIREFPTIEQTKEWLSRDDLYFYGSILDTEEYEFCNLYRNIGGSSRIITTLFTLQDGVMIMQWGGDPKKAQYKFFTDEEWQRVYAEWNESFVILPIDKK